MAANQSYLSSPKYGYDFVVSTTQASINAGLLSYLNNVDQPVTYLCFLADPLTGNLSKQVSLDELLIMTKGVNPFDIPEGTNYDDPRITLLTEQLFVVGIKMQIGLPPGIDPKKLPAPVVVLSGSKTIIGANNVEFNMYCSQFSVIQNSPGGGFVRKGIWNVWSQQPESPWYATTTVNLVMADLDRNLNTTYFNQHPNAKRKLLEQLNNLSGTAFSLQQLLFDLDNAVLQTVPRFQGIDPGSNAQDALTKAFVNIYAENAKKKGLPLVAVQAVAQSPDPSQLSLTAFERSVSPLKDASGQVIQKPTAAEQSATTLDFLCAVDHHPLPGVASFSWNWISPQDVDAESGVIVINRNIISKYILDQLLPYAKLSCIAATTHVNAHPFGNVDWSWTLKPNQTPQTATVTVPNETVNVISIVWQNDSIYEDSAGLTDAVLEIRPSYNCDVSFKGNVIIVTQHLLIFVYVRWDSTSEGRNAFDKTLTDVYTLSVDDKGGLHLTSPISSQVDKSESAGLGAFVNLFTNVDSLITDIKNSTSSFANSILKPIPFNSLQNFIFPGGKTFTYKSAQFSDHQDLICDITYLDPDAGGNQITPLPVKQPPVVPPLPVKQPPVVPPLPVKQPPVVPPLPVKQPPVEPPLPVKQPPVVHPPPGKKPPVVLPLPVEQPPVVPPLPVKQPPVVPPVAIVPAPQQASTDTGLKLTSSCDMMQNYVQGEIVSPQGKFEALQTADSHALLFAIDTSGVFHVIEEQSGQTSTGWVVHDLSTALIKAKYAGANVRTFDAGQSAVDGTIGLAMAVSFGGSDQLLVSLANSSSDTSWTSKPNWTLFAFDATGEKVDKLLIAGILFAEATGHKEYLIVDIDRSPTSAVKDIVRYYIDPSKSTGSYWVRHDVPVDIEAGNYQSCVGRKAKASVDGVYTSGTAAGAGQLVYVPIVNVFGDGPPLPTRLSLPGQVVASAIATARYGSEAGNQVATTDLYAISGSTLYYFVADAQGNDAVAKSIMTNRFFAGTDELTAMIHNGVTTLWGRNSSDQVYYLSCITTDVSKPQAWSSPVPILTGIERISAYVNRTDGGNTIFASGRGKLQKLIQAPGTKLWTTQQIMLGAPPQQKSTSFHSYTTTIHVVDANDLPASGVTLGISTPSRTPVYINGLYYVLGPVAVHVQTGSAGSVTIIEATPDINGAILTVTVSSSGKTTAKPTDKPLAAVSGSAGSSAAMTINPMDQSFNKLVALNSKDALRQATRPISTTAGGVTHNTKYTPLVSPSASDKDVQAVADNMGKLKTVYNSVNAPKQATAKQKPPVVALISFGDAIDTAAGDIYSWLKSGVDAVVEVVEDAAGDVWHFIATIAGQVYRAVLDTAEAVIGAVEWVFNAIKTVIEDIIHFIEFLLEWDDIRRTKDVMHNVIKLYVQNIASNITSARNSFDTYISDVEKTVNQWAGIKDWSPLGSPAAKPAALSTSNPTNGQTSGSQLLSSHFQSQASNLTPLSASPGLTFARQLVDDLLAAISREGQVLSAVYDQLQKLAVQFATLSVSDVLKRLGAILIDGVLSSAQVVVDALLNVLANFTSAAIGILDAPIHIPIISDILDALGISEISYLDLFCWIAAVAYTVVYKIANNSPPFPDNSHTQQLISAPDWKSLAAIFSSSASTLNVKTLAVARSISATKEATLVSSKAAILDSPKAATLDSSKTVTPDSKMTATPGSSKMATLDSSQEEIFVAGHAIAGFISFVGIFLVPFEAAEPTGQNEFSIPSTVLAIIAGAASGAANDLAPRSRIQNEAVRGVSIATLVATILAKLVFSGPAQKQFASSGSSTFSRLAVNDGRATGAIVDSILVVPALFCTSWHFYELSQQPDSANKSAAIVGEVSNLANYMSRLSYAVAVNTKDPESKTAAIVVLGASKIAVAGLETAEALIR